MPRSLRVLGFGGSSLVIPDPVFGVNFYQDTITPYVYPGAAPTFSRSGSKTYFDTPSSVATKAANQPQYAACLWGGNPNNKGLYIDTGTDNRLLYSQDFTNAAWVDVGTITVTGDTEVAPDGTTTADTLEAGADNSGKVQVSGLAAASEFVVLSMWIKRIGSSDVDCTLSISGSGGTPETSTKAVVATDNWSRVFIYKAFTSSATGDIEAQITIDDNGSDIYVWGAQLERKVDTSANNVPEDYLAIPNHYVPTTSSTAITEVDTLGYAADNFSDIFPVGTVSVWFKSLFSAGEMAANNAKYIFALTTSHFLSIAMTQTGANTTITCLFNGVSIHNYTFNSFAKDTWYNFAWNWDNSANPSPINSQLFINGSEVASNTTTVRVDPTLSGIMYMSNSGWGSGFFRNAGGAYFFGQMKAWDTKLTNDMILSEFNATKGVFGL